MPVESAMRQPRLLHHRIHADPIDTVPPKQPARLVHDALPRLGLLFTARPHGPSRRVA